MGRVHGAEGSAERAVRTAFASRPRVHHARGSGHGGERVPRRARIISIHELLNGWSRAEIGHDEDAAGIVGGDDAGGYDSVERPEQPQ